MTFRGIVRDHDHGAAVTALDYQAHPDAAALPRGVLPHEVAAATGLRVAAAHRVGSLVVGDVALVAAVAAPHRAEAFEACARLVELIKHPRADLEAPAPRRRRHGVGRALVPSDRFLRAANGLHRVLQKVSGNRLGWRLAGMTVIELTTVGRKSGEQQVSLLTSPLKS